MVNKTKKGSGFFTKKPVPLDTNKLFKLLTAFRNISDKISDDDFIDSLNAYNSIMLGFIQDINGDDTVDDVNDLINNYDRINPTRDTHMKHGISLNVYNNIIRMDSNFKELLKIINGIIELGVYKYKLLLNQNIPEKILSYLGCRLQDFKQILEYNYFFDKEKTYRGLKWIDNRTKNEKLYDQKTHHYERHNQFFYELKKIDKNINSSNPLFDNLCIRRTARYVSKYNPSNEADDKQPPMILPRWRGDPLSPAARRRFSEYHDDDKDRPLIYAGRKKKGGDRKLKSYK